jgi:hypothetical protein
MSDRDANGTTPAGEPPNGEPTAADPAPVPANGASTDTAPTPPAKKRSRRSPWLTVGVVAVVLLVLAGLGYFASWGPLSRLSTARDLNPPATLAGLPRITDQTQRDRLQLDATRDALGRLNKGKKAAVEAYGDPNGSQMFIVSAIRGQMDIDAEIKNTGATGDQVKEIGDATCVTNTELPTSCYRNSRSVGLLVQDMTGKTNVNKVAQVAGEALDALK